MIITIDRNIMKWFLNRFYLKQKLIQNHFYAKKVNIFILFEFYSGFTSLIDIISMKKLFIYKMSF